MNEQNQADAKLREAAKQKANRLYDANSQEQNLTMECTHWQNRVHNFIRGAKSEAAKEYWQSQQTKVDVNELKNNFENIAFTLKDEDDNLSYEKIFNWFLPHLQPTVEEKSDTVPKSKIEEIRNNLYDPLPTGEVHAFDLLKLINKVIKELDELTEFKNQKR